MVNTVAGRGTVNSPLEKVKAAIHQELLVLDICHESGNKRYLCSTFYLNLFFSLSSAQKVWVSKKINSNKIKSFFAFTYRTDEISNRVKSYIWQTTPGISNSHNIIIIWKKKFDMKASFNPLHPNISMHILHTVLCTFPKVLRRRICLTIRTFFSWWSFPVFFLL